MRRAARRSRTAGDDGSAAIPLRVTDLVKSYGSGPRAVDGVSFEVEAGEVVALLGPNGAGKSTTVGCITGLLNPDAGEVRLHGRDPARSSRQLFRRLGVAGQDVALYPDLAVGDNLRHFGRLAGIGAADIDGAVARTAEVLGLGPLLGRRVRELSGGQQRLVHVAAASVHRPGLLLLDEPTAGLDSRARVAVTELVRELRDAGCGLLYSSHYLQEVEDLCDRVVIVHRGQVVARGSVRELVARHGSSVVEVEIDGVVHERRGVEVAEALAELGRLGRIDDVRVRRPSLEAVFLDLTDAGDDLDQTDAGDGGPS